MDDLSEQMLDDYEAHQAPEVHLVLDASQRVVAPVPQKLVVGEDTYLCLLEEDYHALKQLAARASEAEAVLQDERRRRIEAEDELGRRRAEAGE
jgi:hypothetical protein